MISHCDAAKLRCRDLSSTMYSDGVIVGAQRKLITIIAIRIHWRLDPGLSDIYTLVSHSQIQTSSIFHDSDNGFRYYE